MTLNLDRTTWTRVRFGDVVSNVNETIRDPLAAGIDRVIAMEHLDPGELRITRWGTPEDGTTFTRRVRPGQTLFGKRRAYQRKAAYAEFDAICSGDILTFQANPAKLLPELLPFLVQSDGFYEHALGTSAGSLSPRTNWKDLATYEFDLPPLDEQHRIADLLWALENQRTANRRRDALHERAINRYCLDVYTRTWKSFPAATFDDLGQLAMGRQKAPKYATGVGSTPYLRVANIGELELDLGVVEEMDFSDRDLARFRLVPGDVLLTEGDIVSALNVGRSAIYHGELDDCAFQNTLIRFRPSPDSDSTFYMALFEGMRLAGIFAGAASTTTVTHLGLKRLSGISVPRVPVQQQKGMGDGLRSLLSVRSIFASEQTALSTCRRSLLDELLGG